MGTTLPELMIASAILLGLLASCGLALRASMQYYQRIQEQTALENQLVIAQGFLSRDISETAMAALAWSAAAPDGPSLTFPLPRSPEGAVLVDHAPGNRLLFGTVVSYRVLGAEQKLYRFLDPITPPRGLPLHPIDDLTPPHNAAFYSVPDSKEHKVLAKGVAKFDLVGFVFDKTIDEATPTTDLAAAKLLRIDLELEQKGGREYAVSLSMDIVAKN